MSNNRNPNTTNTYQYYTTFGGNSNTTNTYQYYTTFGGNPNTTNTYQYYQKTTKLGIWDF